MKKRRAMQVAAWVLALVPLALVAVFYSRLPAQVPLHWDISGEVGYGAKSQLFMVAGLAPLLIVLLSVLPKIDPRRRSYEKFGGSYVVFQLVMMLFLAVMVGLVLLESLRPGTADVGMLVCALMSVLFVVLGNMMPKFRQNYFCGIKTPWTLASETVWTRTHRLGGRLFFAAGILGLLGCLLPPTPRFVLLMAALAVATIVPTAMSCIWYRREEAQ